MVQAPGQGLYRHAQLVSEMKTLLFQGRRVDIVKVDRSQNSVSHVLGNFARVEERTAVWLGYGPDCVLDMILQECNVSISVQYIPFTKKFKNVTRSKKKYICNHIKMTISQVVLPLCFLTDMFFFYSLRVSVHHRIEVTTPYG